MARVLSLPTSPLPPRHTHVRTLIPPNLHISIYLRTPISCRHITAAKSVTYTLSKNIGGVYPQKRSSGENDASSLLAGTPLGADVVPGRPKGTPLQNLIWRIEPCLAGNPESGRGYSMRRAFMGSMPAARLAGMSAAKKEQIASATAAMVRAVGSQEETP